MPLIKRASIEIVLPVPTFFVSKVAVAFATERLTTSEPCVPTRLALSVFSRLVASVVALYTRLLAEIPITLNDLAVIDAEVVGWVSV